MITNTASFTQYRRAYDAVTTTANSTYSGSSSTISNAALLSVAGPDGSLVIKISSIPRATVTATQMQLFRSKDGGATLQFFNSVLLASAGYTMAQTTAAPVTTFTQVDGTTISETNPIALTGKNGFGSTTPTAGGTSTGSANAQTLPFATGYTSLTNGSVVDFECGLTNSGAATLAVGTTIATSVVRDYNGASLSAGDLTAGFRYRVWYDGTVWRLAITDRLYIAQGVTLAGGIVTTVQQADF